MVIEFSSFLAAQSQRVCMNITRVLLAAVLIPTVPAIAQDNGIHVGQPKVYDARALQLMMDDLARALRGTNFINAAALASALGNVQGYSATDFSQGFYASGATGPQAAATFANAATGGANSATPSTSAATGSTATTTTTPSVSISIAPTLNAGSAATPGTASVGGSPYGPAAPALPTLQTAPTYNPNFGPSGADLLQDETNLTYQIFNLRMMLERALSDRLYHEHARVQA